MNVLIDSTEYKQDRGLNKEGISMIKELGSKDLIKLHIPWFVYKECTSSCINDISVELSSIQTTLKSFRKKGLDNIEHIKAMKLSKEIGELKKLIIKSNEKLWNKFIFYSNAIFYEYDEKESIEVFKNYFTGGKPFKSLKKRDDIPDAFIYLTIKKVAINEIIHLISNDNNLREKCSDDYNIIMHKSLEDFFNHSDIIPILTKYEKLKEEDRIEAAKIIILSEKEAIDDVISDYIKKITFLEFEDSTLHSDDGVANIYAIDNHKVVLDEEEILFIGEEFFVPIKVEGTASIDYAIFKGDYWMYENMPPIAEDLNKHYFLIEDTVPVIMYKTLKFNINEVEESGFLPVEFDEFDDIKIRK